MGWKLDIGLLVAAVVAVITLRQPIAAALGQTGAALGQGINQAFAQFTAGVTNGLGDFLNGGGALGQALKNTGNSSQQKIYVPNVIKIGSATAAPSDQVITPHTREQSDTWGVLPGGAIGPGGNTSFKW